MCTLAEVPGQSLNSLVVFSLKMFIPTQQPQKGLAQYRHIPIIMSCVNMIAAYPTPFELSRPLWQAMDSGLRMGHLAGGKPIGTKELMTNPYGSVSKNVAGRVFDGDLYSPGTPDKL